MVVGWFIRPAQIRKRSGRSALMAASPGNSLKSCLCPRLSHPMENRSFVFILRIRIPRQACHHPFQGGPPVKTLPLAGQLGTNLAWTTDGSAVVYVLTSGGVSNLWAQPINGTPPKQLTDFTSERIFRFAFSRDGKQLALSRGTQTSDVILINFKQ